MKEHKWDYLVNEKVFNKPEYHFYFGFLKAAPSCLDDSFALWAPLSFMMSSINTSIQSICEHTSLLNVLTVCFMKVLIKPMSLRVTCLCSSRSCSTWRKSSIEPKPRCRAGSKTERTTSKDSGTRSVALYQ